MADYISRVANAWGFFMETYLATGIVRRTGLEIVFGQVPQYWGMKADMQRGLADVVDSLADIFDTVTHMVEDGEIVLTIKSAEALAAKAVVAAAQSAARMAVAMSWWRLVLGWWL